jgi:hypothetical protein
MEKHDIVQFKDGQLVIDVDVTPESETVWINQEQMSKLFDRERSVITRHIGNIFKEKELEKESNVHFLHIANADRPVAYYSLDVIISVGYRVKSTRGIRFRKWAASILKNYLIQGYVLNEKRLSHLNKTVKIQSKMLAAALDSDSNEILKVVNEYTNALSLLDNYDHQSLSKPKGRKRTIPLSYRESRDLIDHM